MHPGFLCYFIPACFLAIVSLATFVLLMYAVPWFEDCRVERVWMEPLPRRDVCTNVTVRVTRITRERTWAEFCVQSAPDDDVQTLTNFMRRKSISSNTIECLVTPLRHRPEIVGLGEGMRHVAPTHTDIPLEFAVIGEMPLWLFFLIVEAVIIDRLFACFYWVKRRVSRDRTVKSE